MHFDTALNLVWLTLGIIALGCTIRLAFRRGSNGSVAWLHVIGVGLIVAALFPYISATDDIVRSETLSTPHDRHHSHSGKKAPDENLIRLFETLDTPLACNTRVLVLAFFLVWMVSQPATERDRHFAPASAGRSPPALACFSA